MTNNTQTTVREAVAIFHNADSLKHAINGLLDAGFDREELGLLASEDVVERSLGDMYARANNNSGSPDAPAIAFVGKEAIGEVPSAVGGSLVFMGTSGVMGAVVVSAAVFGGAALAAIGGIVGVGVVGALVASVINESDASYLQKQVDEGHILLFARVDADREEQAMGVLKQHSGLDVKMYDIPVKSSTEPNAPDVANA